MKRLLPLLLAVCFLCACGSAPVPAEEPKPTEAPVAETATPTPEPTLEPTPEPTPAFDPVVIVDNDDVKFTITGIDPAVPFEWDDMSWTSYGINVMCENKTDKTVLFAWDSASINGYMIDIYWSEKLLPGTKANSCVYIGDDKFQENGIEEAETIGFQLLVMPEIEADVYERENAFVDDIFSFEP